MKRSKIFCFILIVLAFSLFSVSYADETFTDGDETITIENDIISRVYPKVNVEDLKQYLINNEGDTITIKKGNNVVTDGYVGTGMEFIYKKAGGIDEDPKILSVIGDLNGDGLCNTTDVTRFIWHYLELNGYKLTENAQLKSADANDNKRIDIGDISGMVRYITKDEIPSKNLKDYTISLSENSGTVKYNEEKTIYIKNPTGGKIYASSSDTNVARVIVDGNNIKITAVDIGTATITIFSDETDTYKSDTASYNLTVGKADCYLELSETSGSITLDDTKNISVTHNMETLISCSSSNTNIATVAIKQNDFPLPNGRKKEITQLEIKPVGVGTATITVTTAGNSKYYGGSKTYQITVKNRQEDKLQGFIELSDYLVSIANGGSTNVAITRAHTNNISIEVDNDVVTAKYNKFINNTITITSNKLGYSKIRVIANETDTYKQAVAEIDVTSYGICSTCGGTGLIDHNFVQASREKVQTGNRWLCPEHYYITEKNYIPIGSMPKVYKVTYACEYCGQVLKTVHECSSCNQEVDLNSFGIIANDEGASNGVISSKCTCPDCNGVGKIYANI